MKKIKIILALLILTLTNAKSQTIDLNQWKKHLDNSALSYYQKIDSINQFFNQDDSLKTIRKYGYKDFNRWKLYWVNRLDANGYLLNLSKMLDSTLTYGNAYTNKMKAGLPANSANYWVSLGPSSRPIPRSNVTDFKPGTGMVFCLEVNPLNSNIILAGTPNGGIWRTDNSGLSWRHINFYTSSPTRDLGDIGALSIKIDPLDTSRIFVATGSNQLSTGYTHSYTYGILVSENSGETWSKTNLDINITDDININDIAIVGSANGLSNVKIYAISQDYIYRSDNGGTSYTRLNAKSVFGKEVLLSKIEVLPNNHNIIIASGSVLLISYNDGSTWTEYTNKLATFKENRFTNSNLNSSFIQWENTDEWDVKNYAGNNVAEIKYSWQQQLPYTFEIIHRSNGNLERVNHHFIAKSKALIPPNCTLVVSFLGRTGSTPLYTYTRTTTGSSPQDINIDLGYFTNAIAAISYKFILNDNFIPTVLPWIDDSEFISGGYNQITIACHEDLIDKIKLLTHDTDGNTDFVYLEDFDLNNVNSGTYNRVMNGSNDIIGKNGLLECALVNNNNNFDEAYYGNAILYKSTQNGMNTQPVLEHDDNHADIRDIKIIKLNGTNKIIVAHDGGISISMDNGLTFPDKSVGLANANFYNLSVSHNDPDFLIGGVHDDGTLMLNDKQWYGYWGGDGTGESLVIDSDNSNKSGTLFITNKAEKMDLLEFVNTNDPNLKTTNNNKISRRIDFSYVNNGLTIYKMDESSNLIYMSTDKGYNWTTVPIPSNIDLTNVANFEVTDDNKIWVIVTFNWNSSPYSKIFISNDEGQTFKQATYPSTGNSISDIEIFSNGTQSTIWVSLKGFDFEGKRVFKSTDLGDSWGNAIERNSPPYSLGEFPVNTLAYDKFSNVLYAGTDRGVYYFDENDDSWYEYKYGMPKCIVTKLVISYENNKLRAATFGRGLWETQLLCKQATSTLTITSNNEVWNIDKRISQNIEISPGAKLTITKNVLLNENAKITVKPGGVLKINGGTISIDCGGMWQGIIVEGNDGLAQTEGNQGKLEMYGGAKIRYAKQAVKSKNGGILYLHYSVFENCRGGVQIENYHAPIVNGIEARNISRIIGCDFLGNEVMRDPMYTDGGVRESMKWCISLFNVRGVRIQSNVFSNNLNIREDLKGNGITSYMSSFSVTNNTFNNLTYGIESAGIFNPFDNIHVSGNDFNNVNRAITESSNTLSYIAENNFYFNTIGFNDYITSTWAINSRSCASVNYHSNLIDGEGDPNTYGIIVRNAAFGENLVAYNNFTGIEVGTQPEDWCKELTVSCNNYQEDIRLAWVVDPEEDASNWNEMKQQGNDDPFLKQAGNLFYNNKFDSKRVYDIYSSLFFKYYAASDKDEAYPESHSIMTDAQIVSNTINNNSCPSIITPCEAPCSELADLILNMEDGAEKLMMTNMLLKSYADSGNVEQFIGYLEGSTYPNKDQLFLPLYLSLGMDGEAENIIDTLHTNNQIRTDFKQYYQLIAQLFGQEQAFNTLSTSQNALLSDIKTRDLYYADAAANLLYFINNIKPVIEPERRYAYEANKIVKLDSIITNKATIGEVILTVKPNPISMQTAIIQASISKLEVGETYEIFISDVLGRRLHFFQISRPNQEFNLDTKLMESGMYFISLYKGNELLKMERLLKIQ